MAVDLRHGVATILTISMFIMLGNMIKKDHIDPLLVSVPLPSRVQYDAFKVSRQHHVKLTSLSSGPWKEHHEILKPCWGKPSRKVQYQAKGYIFFSLTNGPEYHASQISNAVTIAKQLGAALVLPDVIGIKTRGKRNFGEVYDIKKFVTSLDGIIQVVKDYPSKEPIQNVITMRIPHKVSKEFITTNIESTFKRHRQLRISSHSTSSSTLESAQGNKNISPYECLTMFGSLELQPELHELVKSMVRTLQHLGSNGKFIAIDLTSKSCQNNYNSSKCYDGKEIGQFLKKIGFERDATIYLTQHESNKTLNSLRQYFPNTFVKEALLPIDMKPKYLGLEHFQYEKFIDFNLCSQSDVLVLTSYNQFQIGVVGMRIASGKTQIFEVSRRTSTSATDYLSPYIKKKNHIAYSCFC